MPLWIKVVYAASLCLMAGVILILVIIEKAFGLESEKNVKFLNSVIGATSLLFAMTLTQLLVVLSN